MLGPVLVEENIPIHFCFFNISSALIGTVVLSISQTHAIAPLTRQVVDHMLDRMGYYKKSCLLIKSLLTDLKVGFFFSLECMQVTALRITCYCLEVTF